MPSLNKKSPSQNKLSQSKKPANGVQKTNSKEPAGMVKNRKESESWLQALSRKYNPFK